MTEVSPFWQKLLAAPRAVKVIDFPRVVFGVEKKRMAIRILTQQEQEDAVADAARVARKRLPQEKDDAIGYDELYQRHLATEVLWRACREDVAHDKESDLRAFFPTSDVLGQALNVEEIALLIEHYQSACLEFGPDPQPLKTTNS